MGNEWLTSAQIPKWSRSRPRTLPRKGPPDHFAGMDGAAVDGAVKELFEGEEPVAVVEEEGHEHLPLFAGELGDEVALGVLRACEETLAEELPFELLADECEHLVDRHRSDHAVFARPLGRLESRAILRCAQGLCAAFHHPHIPYSHAKCFRDPKLRIGINR